MRRCDDTGQVPCRIEITESFTILVSNLLSYHTVSTSFALLSTGIYCYNYVRRPCECYIYSTCC